MILAVCLNPALDITYRISALTHGESHPVAVVAERAGGKGINVARVLHQFGADAVVTGLVGGPYGDVVTDELQRDGIRAAFTAIEGNTRRSVAVVDATDVTVFNEPGPTVRDSEWRNFASTYADVVATAQIVALSGSAPPGAPEDCYADLVRTAREAGALTVLDAHGRRLVAALAECPDVVAPNRVELEATLGRRAESVSALCEAAELLRARGAGSVVVSAGADGLVACTPDGAWAARPPRLIVGNPTGAGDALTAALAFGLERQLGWPETLRRAIAWAGGAVATEYAGSIDFDVAARLYEDVEVEELT